MIKDLRIQLNMTQKQVAESTGYSIATISRAENNCVQVSEFAYEEIISTLKAIRDSRNSIEIYNEVNKLLEENDKIIEKHKEEIKTELKEAKERWWKKFCKWN